MDRQTKKTLIVLVVLFGLLIVLPSIGNPWWHGPVLLAFILGIGLPIGALLIWWVEK